MARVGYHDVSPATFRRRRGAVAGFGLALVLAVDFIHGQWSDFRANQAQPACDITAVSGDTVSGLKAELGQAGDSGDSATVFAHQDGHVRAPGIDPRYLVNGSMALEVSDTVRIMHVAPDACQQVGGRAISLAAIQASFNWQQK